jgi:polyphosphate kinase
MRRRLSQHGQRWATLAQKLGYDCAMSAKPHAEAFAAVDSPREHHYRRVLRELQIELVKYQRHLISRRERIVVLLEGRDTAGKDGTIKHIIEHLSPRDTRVVALSAPSSREQTEWYFQRYVEHLPAAAEFVLFNRSWYNRAGVERVMGFCTDAQVLRFFSDAPAFEEMLIGAGIRLFKYYLDIDRDEQVKRLKERRTDPLTQWKISPIDKVAVKHWADYTNCRDEMFRQTHMPQSPWYIVHTNDKHTARLNLIRHLLSQLRYHSKRRELLAFDPDVVFTFTESRLSDGSLAR